MKQMVSILQGFWRYPRFYHFVVGNQSRHSEEACTSHFFSSDNESGHLLIAGGSNEDCPFIGRFVEGNGHLNQ